jgi:hypothetical protein
MALGVHSPTKAWAQPEKGMTVIHVIGSSEIKGNNVQAARESAINNGMISAVSQVIMEMLPADAVTSHFQVINEVILSKTDPYVRDFKVLSESTQAKIYRILVQATVSKTRLADAFKRAGVGLQKRQTLRILLCVAEKGLADLTYRYWWGSQGSAELTPAAAALGRLLMENGFQIVVGRPEEVSGNLSPELSGPEAIALARQLKANIVITGLAVADETPNTMGGDVGSFRGRVDLKVYHVQGGQQIGQSKQSALTAGNDAQADSRQALLNAVQQAAEEVSRQIAAAGLDRSTGKEPIELVIEGTGGNIANFVKFRGALVTMSGVEQVQLKEMMSDTAILLVQYQGDTRTLADGILRQGFDTFGINITEVGRNQLRLKLVTP